MLKALYWLVSVLLLAGGITLLMIPPLMVAMWVWQHVSFEHIVSAEVFGLALLVELAILVLAWGALSAATGRVWSSRGQRSAPVLLSEPESESEHLDRVRVRG